MTTRKVDHQVVLSMSRLLADAASEIDEALAQLPAQVYAGPLAKEIGELVLPLQIRCVEQVVRLRVASLAILLCLAGYEHDEAQASQQLQRIGDQITEL
jgi:hypothetical protein